MSYTKIPRSLIATTVLGTRHALPYAYVSHVLLAEQRSLAVSEEGLSFSQHGSLASAVIATCKDGSRHALPYAYMPHVRHEGNEVVVEAAGWILRIVGKNLRGLVDAFGEARVLRVAAHATTRPAEGFPFVEEVECRPDQAATELPSKGLALWCGKWVLHVTGRGLDESFNALANAALPSIAPSAIVSPTSCPYLETVSVERVEDTGS